MTTALDQGREAVARQVHEAQVALLAKMRRQTTLDDTELMELLSPFGEAAFNAGHRIGWLEYEQENAEHKTEAIMYRWVAFISSAAAVASWIILLRR